MCVCVRVHIGCLSGPWFKLALKKKKICVYIFFLYFRVPVGKICFYIEIFKEIEVVCCGVHSVDRIQNWVFLTEEGFH